MYTAPRKGYKSVVIVAEYMAGVTIYLSPLWAFRIGECLASGIRLSTITLATLGNKPSRPKTGARVGIKLGILVRSKKI